MGSFKIEGCITYWLMIVNRSVRNQLQANLSAHDLYVGQDLLLMSLWREDGQTQAQLARRLDIQQATLTRMTKRMEEAGLVVKREDRVDRRVSRIYLTAAGRKMRKPVERIWEQVEKGTFHGLSTEERLLLRRLLMQLQLDAASSALLEFD